MSQSYPLLNSTSVYLRPSGGITPPVIPLRPSMVAWRRKDDHVENGHAGQV